MTYPNPDDRYASDPGVKGPAYENYVMGLLTRIAEVEHEPSIGGKTPDLLVTDDTGRECIIECTTLSQSPDCLHNLHAFTKDPTRLNERLYNSLREKMRKYGKAVIGKRSYVVAIQNECCGFFDKSVQDVVMGAWRFRHGRWKNLWEGENYASGLFGMYPGCSGVLHSTWTDHLYFPNPRCKIPVSLEIFSFASIVDPRPHPDGHVKVIRQVSSPPNDAVMTTVRGVTFRGLPPGTIVPQMVWKVVGRDEDGTAHLEGYGFDPELLH